MINDYLPSKSTILLKRLIGKKIIQVRRQLFNAYLDKDIEPQIEDGPLEITLNDDCKLYFFSLTDLWSVGVENGEMPKYGESYKLVDKTHDSFWSSFKNTKIIEVAYFHGHCELDPCEVAVEITFESGKNFCVEYLNSNEYQDTLHVVNNFPNEQYEKVNISL